MTSSRSLFANKSTWTLVAITLLFLVPLIFAWYMADEDNNMGRGTTNKGQLIQPPLDFSKLSLQDADKKPLDANVWKGHWLILYVNPKPNCDAVCEKKIYYLRQIHTATGKDRDRVQRAIMTFSGQPVDSHLNQLLTTEYAGTMHFTVTENQFSDFIHDSPAANLALTQGSIYLVDPLGNVLMVYTLDAAPMDIFKDLTKILKLSHIG